MLEPTDEIMRMYNARSAAAGVDAVDGQLDRARRAVAPPEPGGELDGARRARERVDSTMVWSSNAL